MINKAGCWHRDYWMKYHDVVAWLLSVGYVWSDDRRTMLEIAWSGRLGYDHHSLIFNPHSKGIDVIMGLHASGTNPRLLIGTCESLADVQRTHEAIRLISGYPGPEPERSAA